MTKREKVIVGIMCLTVAFGAYDLLGKGGSARRKPASQAVRERPADDVRQFATEMARNVAAQKISNTSQHLIEQAATEWTRDPFIGSAAPLGNQPTPDRPATQSAPALAPLVPQYTYTGFLQVGDTKLAIINGMEYTQGEALGSTGHYVQNISARRVTIGQVRGADTIHLPLREID